MFEQIYCLHMKHDIHINDAKLVYQDVVIFDQLNFCIKANKTTCILGPSGVGKTSLLRMLTGLEAHAADISVKDNITIKHQVAYMGQNDALLPWLSVLQNTLFGYKLRGNLEKTHIEKATKLLQQVGLGDVILAKPKQLSGGMRQRVALVRTVLEDKPIILLDEPFASLDVISKIKLQALLANLLQNRTICLVTHDPMEALRLGHFVYVMRGRPAHFDELIEPKGLPPRAITDTSILELEAKLLQQLTQAQESLI